MRLLLSVLLLTAVAAGGVDIGVDTILQPDWRGEWEGVRFSPVAVFGNHGTETTAFNAWMRLRPDTDSVRYVDSISATLPPGAETALAFREVVLHWPLGTWLAECSAYAGVDSNPPNDRLVLEFPLRRGI
jgi:hypothetical protein